MILNLVKISAAAPEPFMVPTAAKAFEALRTQVATESGRDFLARLADCYRRPGFRSAKKGVADRSWHKAGRAFDYDQTPEYLVIVEERFGGSTYFRTYLKCEAAHGRVRTVRDYRGYDVSGCLYDFTDAAERLGWKRIPAWRNWQRHYNYREFWHYQFTEGLTLEQAMRQITSVTKPRLLPQLQFGATGDDVRTLQALLVKGGLLQSNDIDGFFGPITRAAVVAFQQRYRLKPDGIVGPKTSRRLYELYG